MFHRQKLVTVLWYDGRAEEAAQHYLSIFKNSKLLGSSRPNPAGPVLTVSFEPEGREFMALNGGPMFKFTEAISIMVTCESQDEIDYYWSRLCEGGQESQCGWLKDRFGLSWQVYPSELAELTGDPDPERAARATAAMLQMRRIDIEAIRAAADGAGQPAS